MIQELQSKFKSMTEFSPEYVEKFICKLGLSDEINFLPNNISLYDSWFNKTFKFGFQDFHVHHPSTFSGVFYYDCLQKEEKGIQFNIDTYYSGYRLITYNYKPGRIILFPGNLFHRVPYKSDEGVRKSFSFNFLYY